MGAAAAVSGTFPTPPSDGWLDEATADAVARWLASKVKQGLQKENVKVEFDLPSANMFSWIQEAHAIQH